MTHAILASTNKPTIKIKTLSESKLIKRYYALNPAFRKTFVQTSLILRNIRQTLVVALPYELITHIHSFCIPSEFDGTIESLILLTPLDELNALLVQLGTSLENELTAIRAMRDTAIDKEEDTDLEIGQKYFDYQYGEKPIDQFHNLLKEFGKLPSQINADPRIKKAFVNDNFMSFWENIALSMLFILTILTKQMTRLPSNIQTLRELEKLILKEFSLTSLPPQIGKLSKLTDLDLSGNHLTFLPREIDHLTNLKTLLLDNNAFTDETKEALRKRFAHIQILVI